MNKTIVLVLRSGGDFELRDVELICRHINGKWKSGKPRIICLYDKATGHYDLGNFELLPLNNDLPGTWSRMMLYSPDMEQYKPFLYIDLDTAIIQSLENIFDLVKDERQFIVLEDFYQSGQLATGLVWFPANSKKTDHVWDMWQRETGHGNRMDYFLRKHVTADIFWQRITNSIQDFKPRKSELLTDIPSDTNVVCFHGKPRIHDAMHISWVNDYVKADFKPYEEAKVTVIIPYKINRGWLDKAIESVPEGVQLLISQGEGNWPENFNKVLDQATGDYIKWLHEDDMLTPNCIQDSVFAIIEQDVDFIHGNAFEIFPNRMRKHDYRPSVKIPTLEDLLNYNVIHSATLMYRKTVFDKIGMLDETLNSAEEYEFNLRCLKAGLKIGYCDNYLAYYRKHNKQKVRVVPLRVRMKEKEMVKKMYI